MKIARLSLEQGPRYAVLDEENAQYLVLADDPMFGKFEPTGQRVAMDDARIVAPMLPRSKVVGVAGTYPAPGTAGADRDRPALDDLLVFLKPNTAVIGPNDPIVLPAWAPQVDHEVELAVVIGRVSKDIPADRAEEAVFGYTVANDVTARLESLTRAKTFDTACPVGPIIDTSLDPSDLQLVSRVDGQQRRAGRTSELAYAIPELVSYLSTLFTLLPGDIILTGTPTGDGLIEAGQTVEVECEGIGVLRNPVVRQD